VKDNEKQNVEKNRYLFK